MKAIKFWGWLFLLSKKQYKKEHLDKKKTDMKCPNCKEWFSISGLEHKHKQKSSEGLHRCYCGQCGHISYWSSNIAPVLMLVDSNEQPIT